MDLGIIFTILGGFALMISILVFLFFWNRSEARTDSRQYAQDIKELRRELIDVMRSIDQEIKDFHGRLCSMRRTLP